MEDLEVQVLNKKSNMALSDIQVKVTKLDFNDLLIEPKQTTRIKSRKEVHIFDSNGKLPLFTAPMDTVVDSENEQLFKDLGVNVCLPRGLEGKDNSFVSYSLNDFKEIIIKKELPSINGKKKYVLIDTANGHIKDMIHCIRIAKKKWGKQLVLMVGNVANSKTYEILSDAGADLIRCGIGNGNGCLTTQQLGVGYPMASLIRECYIASCSLENPAKIVADGGMKSYSDVIKALALGADYVMLGSIFNKSIESCGKNYIFENIPIPSSFAKRLHKLGFKVFKKFRGMSTKEVQKKWGSLKLKTSEGVVRIREVEYTLEGWVDNFKSYLRSAMSYSDSFDLEEFVNKANFIKISENALKRFNK